MVKRVFKNKRLIRNILILAGLVIVGFFLWRSFVWTRLLEGNDAPDGSATQETPDGSVTQETPQGTTASPSCTAGEANPPIVEHYPGDDKVMPEVKFGNPCPPPSGPVRWIRHPGNPGLCVVTGHTPARAGCKQHVETWKKCVNGAALYNDCITQPGPTRPPLMNSCQPAYDTCVAAATTETDATACRGTYISCINPSTATPSASQPST